jgi:Gram-negative porin
MQQGRGVRLGVIHAIITVGLFTAGSFLGPGAVLAAGVTAGGDCCADLEERVSELEAATARKATKTVSLEVYGLVNESVESWDDGGEAKTYVLENSYKSSRFGLRGTAEIGPGWEAGYRFEAENRAGYSRDANQSDDASGDAALYVRQSNMFLKNETYGTLTWGLASTAKDNTTKDNVVTGPILDTTSSDFFATQGFYLRSAGTHGATGLSSYRFIDIARCYSTSSGLFDCSTRRDEVSYETPKWNGFTFSADWATGDIWSLAARYKADWGRNWKAAGNLGFEQFSDHGDSSGVDQDIAEWSGSASIMHVPSGLWAFSAFTTSDDRDSDRNRAGVFTGTDSPEMVSYDVAGGIQKGWFALGNTTLWGGYTNSRNGIGGVGGADRLVTAGSFYGVNVDTEITGSTVSRWYLAADQAVDAASMDLYIVYQHIDPSVALVDANLNRVAAPLDDFDVVFAGARLYF